MPNRVAQRKRPAQRVAHEKKLIRSDTPVELHEGFEKAVGCYGVAMFGAEAVSRQVGRKDAVTKFIKRVQKFLEVHGRSAYAMQDDNRGPTRPRLFEVAHGARV